MDFLKVDGEQYIKVDSIIEVLDTLEAEAKNDESPQIVKDIIGGMMDVLKNIFTSAVESDKEQIKQKDIDIVKNPQENIVGLN